MALLELSGVTKRFGGVVALDNVSLEVGENEFLALLARRLPVSARTPVIFAVAVASLAWGLLPIHTAEGVNFLNWPPAYASWFAAGMVLAEATVSKPGWMHRLARRRVVMAVIVIVAYLLSASPLAGPERMIPATLSQFVVRTALGAVIAWALLAPLVLDRPDTSHRILGSQTMVTLGRWSYGLFVWHLVALEMAFPMVGQFIFDGAMPVIFDPRVASSLIGHLLGAILGPSIARRSSFLLDSLGDQIFDSSVTIMDDPHRPREIGRAHV